MYARELNSTLLASTIYELAQRSEIFRNPLVPVIAQEISWIVYQ